VRETLEPVTTPNSGRGIAVFGSNTKLIN
jgi:hypothetical protein